MLLHLDGWRDRVGCWATLLESTIATGIGAMAGRHCYAADRHRGYHMQFQIDQVQSRYATDSDMLNPLDKKAERAKSFTALLPSIAKCLTMGTRNR